MKEITRRLYTKPVMLGMAFVAVVGLMVTLFVTAKSKAQLESFPVAAGNDEFVTAADGETFHDFSGSPVPANFFGAGSNAYSGLVALEGVPLGPESQTDTIIERQSAVNEAGGSTGIQMTALSLKGSNPITVTYSNAPSETWDVSVGLSQFKASGGTMTINYSTFDSTLKVWPRFTFTRESDGLTKVLDTGGSGSGLAAAASQPAGSAKLAVGDQTAVAIAQCKIIAVDATLARSDSAVSAAPLSAAAASSCAPVTLSSVNSPWGPCAPNTFCITVPITEEERWARHRPRPRPTSTIVIGD